MIFSAFILLAYTVNQGYGVTLELYSEQKYSGLVKTITVNQTDEAKCIRFDQIYEVRSIKTDKCVIVYETGECMHIDPLSAYPTMYSLRIEKNTALFNIDGAYSSRKEERGVRSFHVCGSELGGGPKLNVDIYSGPFYTGDLAASSRGVCKCTNIPSYIALKECSIDNHGNSMYFYDRENCTGQERLIPAGDNDRSRSVFRLDGTRGVAIKSFRPAGDSSCLSLDASIYKFTLVEPLDKSGITETTQQVITHELTNTKHTTVKEDFVIHDWSTLEYSVAKPFTFIHTAQLKAGFFIEPQGILMPEKLNTLQRSFEAHYQYTDTNQSTATIVTMPWEDHHVSVDKSPCSKCPVSISVTRVQGWPISYTAEAIITEVAGDDKVSAEQIRPFLPPGMKYVKDNDDYSVVVTVEGDMKSSYHDYSSQVTCHSLPNC